LNIPVRLSRAIHLISALWTLALAVLIFVDVCGRSIYAQPVPGTKEIIQNSIVAITFLQLPLAIYSGSMLRTTVFADAVPKMVRRVFRTICYLLGIALFVGLIISTYEPLIDAYRIGEYEGEGALRVPVWPVRGLIFVMSFFCLFAYLSMIYYDWTGKLERENSAPGSSGETQAVASNPG
jgi:TRAP-type C4-dicarboxylate transport system permease small subunit